VDIQFYMTVAFRSGKAICWENSTKKEDEYEKKHKLNTDNCSADGNFLHSFWLPPGSGKGIQAQIGRYGVSGTLTVSAK
jgi:hypothetical protein